MDSMDRKYKVAIAGTGYVGLSMAVLLAQHNKVFALDIVEEKVQLINQRRSPIVDREIEEFLAEEVLDLVATTDPAQAYSDADFIIISTPTNYDEQRNSFDTRSIEAAIESALRYNRKALFVIKSTIPIGYTQTVREKFGYDRILFSPEFLREGRALYDNLYPSRIIVGVPADSRELMRDAAQFASLLSGGARKTEIPTLYTGLAEAESIKLFANTYLAMRVSYFNELDTFAEQKGLDAKQIIEGVGLDPRIGTSYNNPSFGYGGYCLPKDTKQLLANFEGIPNNMIQAIVDANVTRKEYIAGQIFRQACAHGNTTASPVVGVFRLVMKSGSDNFRQSSIQDVMDYLCSMGAKIVVYEPTVQACSFNGYTVVNDLDIFKKSTDLIVANRFNEELEDVREKVYSRDVFSRD